MQISMNTPQPGEGFRVELRGRHPGELKDFLQQSAQSVQPCPDSGDPRRGCPACESWAMVAAILGTDIG